MGRIITETAKALFVKSYGHNFSLWKGLELRWKDFYSTWKRLKLIWEEHFLWKQLWTYGKKLVERIGVEMGTCGKD